MYADDPEGLKLNYMPGVDEMLVVYPLLTNILGNAFLFQQMIEIHKSFTYNMYSFKL